MPRGAQVRAPCSQCAWGAAGTPGRRGDGAPTRGDTDVSVWFLLKLGGLLSLVSSYTAFAAQLPLAFKALHRSDCPLALVLGFGETRGVWSGSVLARAPLESRQMYTGNSRRQAVIKHPEWWQARGSRRWRGRWLAVPGI